MYLSNIAENVLTQDFPGKLGTDKIPISKLEEKRRITETIGAII
jgi:hypothetical protein